MTAKYAQIIALLLLIPCLAIADTRTKASAYTSFTKRLSPEEKHLHALDRLTFGARPGDEAQLERLGLKKWLDEELHPERVPENPRLVRLLTPFASLDLSIRDTYTRYPSPQMIAAFAKGRGTLPEDPELRAVIEQLAARYLMKKNGEAVDANATTDDADLPAKSQLSDLLTADQIKTLQTGKADEKKQVLASIPADKRFDFAWALRPAQRRQLFDFAPVELRRDLMLTVNPQNVVASDLSEAKILRAVYGRHQLAELLDDFWFNHFNVFLNKGGDRYFLPTYEREAIRPHLFGKFYDLLLATAQSPAMLFYLDNWQSAGPEATAQASARGKGLRGLNENYGRELLELHTLGVDGGYTQEDVIAVARCFTGWTIAQPRKGGGFTYNDKLHDKGSKTVLGHVIAAGGGMNDGLEVLKILARQPATAHHISLELAERFVADNPPPSLVKRMEKIYLKTDGDLREVVKTMITAPEFWSEGAYRAKVKSPFEMLVSALRCSNADVSSAFLVTRELQKLGEPLYRKIEPTGYPSANSEWVSSAALLERLNFSLTLAHNRLAGITVDSPSWQTAAQKDPVAFARTILQRQPDPQTDVAITKTIATDPVPARAADIAGVALGSPEFQRR